MSGGADSLRRFFTSLSLWLGCRAAAPLDVFLATHLPEHTGRAGIAMELLSYSGVEVSLETYSQSCVALGQNVKHKLANGQR